MRYASISSLRHSRSDGLVPQLHLNISRVRINKAQMLMLSLRPVYKPDAELTVLEVSSTGVDIEWGSDVY